MLKSQIIALGGGGFGMEPENLLLDEYILSQSGRKKPKVCFIPTASADSAEYTVRFYRAYSQLNCTASHLSLFSPPTADIESFVLEKDVIFVGGGNTKNLLALWKEWELDRILKKAWKKGIVLSGVSAGSLCWFESGITDSIPGDLTPIKCLGFLKGSNCPHYDGEIKRRPRYHHWIEKEAISKGIAADDGVALHYVGDRLEKIVSSQRGKNAYEVKKVKGKIQESKLSTHFLG